MDILWWILTALLLFIALGQGVKLYGRGLELRRLKYICLTNANVEFYDNGRFWIRVKPKGKAHWVGDIEKVYGVFSSPNVYQLREATAKNADLVEDLEAAEYQPGSWKSKA